MTMSPEDQTRLKRLKYEWTKKFPGYTLEMIGQAAGGVKYLDWAIGQDWMRPGQKKDIEAFLRQFHKQEWDEISDDT